MSHSVGEQVFFVHPEHSWVTGRVKEVSHKPKRIGGGTEVEYVCQVDQAQVGSPDLPSETIPHLKEDQVHAIVAIGGQDGDDVDDLLSLSYLHDSTLLSQVRQRYWKDTIYTLIGPIVLALNPFDYNLPNYTSDKMPKYLAEGDSVVRSKSANIPHAWSTAHRAYWLLRTGNGNQSVIVSGESGAGKTETAKIVLKYMAAVSTQQCNDEQRSAAEEVNTRVVLTSPILEAFGNAKTKRNDNSSRFGKFMKVHFSPQSGTMVGADIEVYLLEKSRIVVHASEERAYHSFYQLLKGGDRSLKNALYLDQPSQYPSLAMGNAINTPSIDDEQDFHAVEKAMNVIGFSQNDQEEIWKTVAAVLHTLQLKFYAATEDAAGLDANNPVNVKAKDALSKLWGVDPELVVKEFLTTTTTVGGETFTKTLRLTQAVDARDALCKAVYERLFLFLVERINHAVSSNPEKTKQDNCWVGLLDIFGFEHFQTNSLEQLCINLANETLQNHYNAIIFTRDMEECHEEGIDTESVLFYDNQPCLDLVCGYNFSALTKSAWAAHSKNATVSSPTTTGTGGKNPSLFSLIDEESKLGKGSDLSFLDKASQRYEKHPNFEKPKTAKSTFIVKHYAGDVTYSVDGFREKNLDTLKESLKVILSHSTSETVRHIFPTDETVQSRSQMTVTTLYRQQLIMLMTELNATHPHWIRCVKPHACRKPRHFCGTEVMTQLRSAGVLETVRIRKMSFSMRFLFFDFCKHFRIILKDKWKTRVDDKTAAMEILKLANVFEPAKAQVGKSKVFLKTDAYYAVARFHHNLKHELVVRIQSFVSRRQSAACVRQRQLLQYVRWMQSFAAARQSRKVRRAHWFVLQLTRIQGYLHYRPSMDIYRRKELKERERYLLENFRGLLMLQSKEADERGVLIDEERTARENVASRNHELGRLLIEFRERSARQSLFASGYVTPLVHLSQQSNAIVEEMKSRSAISVDAAAANADFSKRAQELKEEVAAYYRQQLLLQLTRVQVEENRLRTNTRDEEETLSSLLFRLFRVVVAEALARSAHLVEEANDFKRIAQEERIGMAMVEEVWWFKKEKRDREAVLQLRKDQHSARTALYRKEEVELLQLMTILEMDFTQSVRLETKRLEKAFQREQAKAAKARMEQEKERQRQLEEQRRIAQEIWRRAEEERLHHQEQERQDQLAIAHRLEAVAESVSFLNQFKRTKSSSVQRNRGAFSSPLIGLGSERRVPSVATERGASTVATPRTRTASSTPRLSRGRSPSPDPGALVVVSEGLIQVPLERDNHPRGSYGAHLTNQPRRGTADSIHLLKKITLKKGDLQRLSQHRGDSVGIAVGPAPLSPEEKHQIRRTRAISEELGLRPPQEPSQRVPQTGTLQGVPGQLHLNAVAKKAFASRNQRPRQSATINPFSPAWAPPDADHVYLPDGTVVSIVRQESEGSGSRTQSTRPAPAVAPQRETVELLVLSDDEESRRASSQ